MVEKYIHEYIFSGSLPDNASTYVKREADDELYEALQQGKFCYVLNSRQTGKSSLRLRTMSRLSLDGVECASIDLSSINIQSATQENWYADLIAKLIDSFVLDVDFKDWWENNQLTSPLMRFTNFLEKHLLVEIEEDIVIFIDEIDSVLSLNFPTDDFFAFIRACYNQRVDNPEYNRLTFCLLGVASPSNLIQDKQRTPFNIGKVISLKGFKLDEVEPLELGLREKFNDSQAVIQEILNWTGGQPFLTQKLCHLMVEESEKEKPRTVEQVVKSRIIESWESQDEPEHLRTICNRVLIKPQCANSLLGLYKIILQQVIITADHTQEQIELRLSGLVVEQQRKLKVYNRIYQEVFNLDWVNRELKNLRPDFYASAFDAWFESNHENYSHLLKGEQLGDALAWAEGRSLSNQDYQFITASQKWEFAQARKKTQRQILIGGVVLAAFVALATIAAVFASVANQQRLVAVSQRNEANKQQKMAESDLKEAKLETKGANRKTKTAQEQFTIAKKQAVTAQRQAKNANKQQLIAENNLKTATTKQRTAEAKVTQAEKSLTDAKRKLRLTEQTATDKINETETRAKQALDKVQYSAIKLQRLQAEQNKVEEGIKIDKLADVALQQSKIYTQTVPPYEALYTAMNAGNQLNKLIKDGRSLEKYPTVKPIFALQKILDTLQSPYELKENQPENQISSVDFSPDGKKIVTISQNDELCVDKKLIRTRYGIELVQDKNKSDCSSVKVWDVKGRLINILKGHQDKVNSAIFSPDGEKIVTTSDDLTAKIWSTEGKLLVNFKNHQDVAENAVFSPDGKDEDNDKDVVENA
ncbi:MAG: AAA-like domain-containing protein, partial [Rivularia sp. (in: cyanobacteria)]